mmetsp:Transcript_9508/g.21454  ORF Transcript_9508/g.21454 Transcript_9508/m.21454 type:complete len:225 (-) Transcript_9508:10-684(-)
MTSIATTTAITMPPAPRAYPNKDNLSQLESPTADDMTIKTDQTTAAADNTSHNNHKGKDASERARSHWDFVKSLHASQKQSQKQIFKMGEKVSLTTAEATFLNMVAKSRLEVDHSESIVGSPTAAACNQEGAVDAEGNSNNDGQEVDNLGVNGRSSHFAHLVQAAVAKERLRDAISARLSALSGAESKFLTSLVNNKNVTLEALENAVHVLDNDPLYNPSFKKG